MLLVPDDIDIWTYPQFPRNPQRNSIQFLHHLYNLGHSGSNAAYSSIYRAGVRSELVPCPPALGMSVDTSFAAVDHLTSSAETCDLITRVHLQESQGLCAHGNETEMGLKIPVCPGLSNTQCLSDIGLHSGNPVDPHGTFMGVEA